MTASGKLHRSQRLAVKRAIERDKAAAARFKQRMLHRRLDRLGSGIPEDNTEVVPRSAS
jgi:hypothetical protein